MVFIGLGAAFWFSCRCTGGVCLGSWLGLGRILGHFVLAYPLPESIVVVVGPHSSTSFLGHSYDILVVVGCTHRRRSRRHRRWAELSMLGDTRQCQGKFGRERANRTTRQNRGPFRSAPTASQSLHERSSFPCVRSSNKRGWVGAQVPEGDEIEVSGCKLAHIPQKGEGHTLIDISICAQVRRVGGEMKEDSFKLRARSTFNEVTFELLLLDAPLSTRQRRREVKMGAHSGRASAPRALPRA
ncbi:hypothetical protein M413DRAFT_233864 [Hebeloma cylindrosporum]|uniref:Uncharacterized protein n=1 Tax=Hebeloma cylindrosporum TaxID=76867 RepID=A0A0C2XMS1_HEBCY|nr:hypothetical protein M413DRAFT_233864 [Hebeloma cylindrosporum h7]